MKRYGCVTATVEALDRQTVIDCKSLTNAYHFVVVDIVNGEPLKCRCYVEIGINEISDHKREEPVALHLVSRIADFDPEFAQTPVQCLYFNSMSFNRIIH